MVRLIMSKSISLILFNGPELNIYFDEILPKEDAYKEAIRELQKEVIRLESRYH